MSKKQTGPSVDLGELQRQLVLSVRAYNNSEGVLKRAQESRDRARARFQQDEQALRDATRTVLG